MPSPHTHTGQMGRRVCHRALGDRQGRRHTRTRTHTHTHTHTLLPRLLLLLQRQSPAPFSRLFSLQPSLIKGTPPNTTACTDPWASLHLIKGTPPNTTACTDPWASKGTLASPGVGAGKIGSAHV